MEKHAYLLMIHEQNDVLKVLLSMLDDERNDIYIHVDKNCKDFSFDTVKSWVGQSAIYFTKRYKVVWSGYSMVKTELILLKTAIKQSKNQPYQYYHLLSGSDLPIKNQDTIHNWFTKHKGNEFVHFGTKEYQRDIGSRYQVYHFFQQQLGRHREESPFFDQLDCYALAAQRRLHVNRNKRSKVKFYGGANWFSITHELASYLTSHIRKYRWQFAFVQNCDEIFLQTMIMNSSFKDKLHVKECSDDYRSIMRYIDWNRAKDGGPHTFTMEDYETLMQSEYLFARKFNQNIDLDIVYQIQKL